METYSVTLAEAMSSFHTISFIHKLHFSSKTMHYFFQEVVSLRNIEVSQNMHCSFL